jgi:uncharacterized membrane protein
MIDWKKQSIDQGLHALLGFVCTLPVLLLPFVGWKTYLATILISIAIGIYREVTQMMKAKRGWYMDRTIDSLFHIPGGILTSIIANFI